MPLRDVIPALARQPDIITQAAIAAEQEANRRRALALQGANAIADALIRGFEAYTGLQAQRERTALERERLATQKELEEKRLGLSREQLEMDRWWRERMSEIEQGKLSIDQAQLELEQMSAPAKVALLEAQAKKAMADGDYSKAQALIAEADAASRGEFNAARAAALMSEAERNRAAAEAARVSAERERALTPLDVAAKSEDVRGKRLQNEVVERATEARKAYEKAYEESGGDIVAALKAASAKDAELGLKALSVSKELRDQYRAGRQDFWKSFQDTAYRWQRLALGRDEFGNLFKPEVSRAASNALKKLDAVKEWVLGSKSDSPEEVARRQQLLDALIEAGGGESAFWAIFNLVGGRIADSLGTTTDTTGVFAPPDVVPYNPQQAPALIESLPGSGD